MLNLQARETTELKKNFRGEVLLPSDDGYESARKIWNATIDKHPALIVRCTTTSNVVHAVNFARDNGLLLAVRGGGHNIAGLALCDDGIVIDLSQMKAAKVDAGARRVTVEGGATLADLDAATQVHGLATPLGINSTTGVAGLTLGGGFGWLSRKYGMTVDNLESADGVLARALTGPIARGDAATVERHLAALDARLPEVAALYRHLARRTVAIARRKQADSDVSAAALDTIAAALEHPRRGS